MSRYNIRKNLFKLFVLFIGMVISVSCGNNKKSPETVRELMESNGWIFCQMIETDLVYQWDGNTIIRGSNTFDLFKKGSDYVVTPSKTDTRFLKSYSDEEGYLTPNYWIRYYAFSGEYTITGSVGSGEREKIVTRNYTGRTEGDSNNNGARHYFRIGGLDNSCNDKHSDVDESYISSEEDSDNPETEEQVKKYKQCPLCYGTTRCGGCGGSGSVYNSIDYSPGQYVDCSACGGSGACGLCEGTGVVEDFGW